MQHFTQINSSTYNYHALHFGIDHLRSRSKVASLVEYDLSKANITTKNLKGQKILVSFLGEGHTFSMTRQLIDYLVELTGNAKLVRCLYSGIDNVVDDSYDINVLAAHMSNHRQYLDKINASNFSKSIKYKFSCLNRIPKTPRAKLLGQILNHVDLDDICCSFASYEGPILDKFKQWFADSIKLPLYIDGMCTTDDDQIAYEAYNSLFNVVTETNSWDDSIFLTEKTFKCFAFGCLPIMSSLRGTVTELRKLKFDLFDDIIDHSYNTIDDEDTRISATSNEVARLNSMYSLEDCQQMYVDLSERLDNNRKRLAQLAEKSQIQKYTLTEEFYQR